MDKGGKNGEREYPGPMSNNRNIQNTWRQIQLFVIQAKWPHARNNTKTNFLNVSQQSRERTVHINLHYYASQHLTEQLIISLQPSKQSVLLKCCLWEAGSVPIRLLMNELFSSIAYLISVRKSKVKLDTGDLTAEYIGS